MTTNTTMEQIFFNILRQHENDPCYKMDHRRGQIEGRQQGVVRPVGKWLSATVSKSIIGPAYGQSITPTTPVLQMRTN